MRPASACGGEPAGGGDGVGDPAARWQLVDARRADRAGDVDHEELRDATSWSWRRRRPWCWRRAGRPPAGPAAAAAARTRRPPRPRHDDGTDQDARRAGPGGVGQLLEPLAPRAGRHRAQQDRGVVVESATSDRGCRARSLPGRDEAASRGKDRPIVVTHGSALEPADLRPGRGPPSRPRSRAGCGGRPPSAGSTEPPAQVGAEVAHAEAGDAEAAPLPHVHELVAQQPRRARPPAPA